MVHVHMLAQIGRATIRVIEYDGDCFGCDYISPSVGMTLAMGTRDKAAREFDKVTRLSPRQLHQYINAK